MKIMTILGTRPEIIRLSTIIPKLDKAAEHVLVHTGQNYAACLNDIFFTDLKLRRPDHCLDIREATAMQQVGRILVEVERLMQQEKPDRLLILGDTNSGLSSIVANRMGIPVYHMEAGNRCYDDRVPEEVNRRIIDHCSSVLMPYTYRSKENLVREGIERERMFVVGNPIYEVMQHYDADVCSSTVKERMGLSKKGYFLVTIHRAEGVDVPHNLERLVEALKKVHEKYKMPVVCSFHPRTKNKMEANGIDWKSSGITFVEPLSFFDFINLERDAFCALSDSGTVQEECCIMKVPNVTLREVTERPETVECGSNILSGYDPQTILNTIELVVGRDSKWQPPKEYLEAQVSNQVLNIILGYSGKN
ncbi:MAG: UDP-N-acetylglucosamine 2-epimerase (non-hydrolyzing) [Deltaproteobacteria bacterium CG11_big_fil_rev_8_21_14_0_20_47_16]|nr:MAG: UDP-N-acetylglucosamine 2-epimerase (non-hydrolyzing) [Deltaproteobacteria bacterium CG11_big_fil_rev_8_21_14_0_20_47_16]